MGSHLVWLQALAIVVVKKSLAPAFRLARTT